MGDEEMGRQREMSDEWREMSDEKGRRREGVKARTGDLVEEVEVGSRQFEEAAENRRSEGVKARTGDAVK